MKKILFIFAFMALALGAMAQVVPGTPDYIIKSNGGIAGVSNTTAATVVAATSYVWRIDCVNPYYYAYQVELDDNTGSNTASVVLSASVTGNHDYKTIATIAYAGVGTDTTIIGAVSTAVPYRFLKLTVTPSDTIWVKELAIKAAPIAK